MYCTIQLLQAACAEEERCQYLKAKSERQLEDVIVQINRLKNSEAANFQFPKPDAQDRHSCKSQCAMCYIWCVGSHYLRHSFNPMPVDRLRCWWNVPVNNTWPQPFDSTPPVTRPRPSLLGIDLRWISAVKTKTGEYTPWIIVTSKHRLSISM